MLKNKKKSLLIAVPAVAILAGIGVAASNSDTTEEAVEETTSVTAPAQPAPEADRAVVTKTTTPWEVESDHLDDTTLTEQAWQDAMAEQGIPAPLDLGYSICDALDAGATPTDVIRVGLDNGLTAHDVGYVLGASVAAFCPTHLDALGTDQ